MGAGAAAVAAADFAAWSKERQKRQKDIEAARRDLARAQRETRDANLAREQEIRESYEKRREALTKGYDRALGEIQKIGAAGHARIARQGADDRGMIQQRAISSGFGQTFGGMLDTMNQSSLDRQSERAGIFDERLAGMRADAQYRRSEGLDSLESERAAFIESIVDQYPDAGQYLSAVEGAANDPSMQDFRAFAPSAGYASQGARGGAVMSGGMNIGNSQVRAGKERRKQQRRDAWEKKKQRNRDYMDIRGRERTIDRNKRHPGYDYSPQFDYGNRPGDMDPRYRWMKDLWS